ncbi:5-dehydro-4-deoxy-D-glucuronate isomerase [Paenibacillus turpanensis]|uniref:5-dehydro-4-deoxy-D-glucuronate isomerase n=1 Tax=Paenibacillus turpanensis TaxID=2689078 RepID=UPI00140DE166|nr:5-dehydro-4-deoxy-D-glucuronate isomerase [Paenibacillus turpanensis]
MEIRHATNPNDAKHYTTDRLRQEYLIENMMTPGELRTVYTHQDRVIVGGAVPTTEPLKLDVGDKLKTEYFLERREIGIISVGEPIGIVVADGVEYTLEKRDCLYIGMGTKEVTFRSADPQNPARFFLMSSTAHKTYPTRKVAISEAQPTHLGALSSSNERTIYKYIHGDGINSCQLMLGMTLLKPNNMWNTMPAHVHDRRMEAYFYFDMEEDTRVFHFMGEPSETRHLVVKNEQAIISPNWSIHSGVGTSNYTFIWGMAGENYTFTDMDFVDMKDLR